MAMLMSGTAPVSALQELQLQQTAWEGPAIISSFCEFSVDHKPSWLTPTEILIKKQNQIILTKSFLLSLESPCLLWCPAGFDFKEPKQV